MWAQLDELAKECPGVNYRTREGYLQWVLNYYIWLCKQNPEFKKGVLP